jgi:hypothetical protein
MALKFMALQGALYIYDISRLRVKHTNPVALFTYRENAHCSSGYCTRVARLEATRDLLAVTSK